MTPVEICEARSRLSRRRFFALPRRLAREEGTPHAGPEALVPLRLARRRQTSVRLFLALRQGRVAGRIALFLDRGAGHGAERGEGGDAGERTMPAPARFGLFASEDDPRVVRALVETCAEEARRRGYRRLVGPTGATPLDPLGLLGGEAGAARETEQATSPHDTTPPLVAPAGRRHARLLGDAGLAPVPDGTVLVVDLTLPSETPAAALGGGEADHAPEVSPTLGLQRIARSDAVAVTLRALARERERRFPGTPAAEAERSACARRLARLAVRDLSLLLHDVGPARTEPIHVLGLADRHDARAARRFVRRTALGDVPARPAGAAVHVVTVSPGGNPLPHEALTALLDRVRALGFGRATVTRLATGGPEAVAGGASEAPPDGITHARPVLLFARTLDLGA